MYDSRKQLPDAVRNHLPLHAQDIYLKAFNNAWEEYTDPDKRRDDASQEEVAHRVAWAAVKKVYKKEGDEWVEK